MTKIRDANYAGFAQEITFSNDKIDLFNDFVCDDDLHCLLD